MFLSTLDIQPGASASDIVSKDHRAADVFRKYGIDYCCGGKWPLETACLSKGISLEQLQEELQIATRTLQLPGFLPFAQWPVDFLIDFIVRVHHYYLEQTLPALWPILNEFVNEHVKKYPGLYELQTNFRKLQKDVLPHLREEEEAVFPYIRQLAHAYEEKNPYGVLLVKTLRKPIEKLMIADHDEIPAILENFRRVTNNYTLPEKACASHRVVFSKLRELDNDLSQHVHLENEILFPKALAMEKELLQRAG